MGPQQGSRKQNKQAKNERMAAARQRIAEQREREAKSARRRSIIIGSVAAVVAIGVVAGLAAIVMTEDDKKSGAASGAPVDAEVTQGTGTSAVQGVSFWSPAAGHTKSEVDYKQVPPVGGKHNEEWQTCGVYNQPIPNKHAVHSLEHGAVWITYDPSLPAEAVNKLKEKSKQPYMLLSPMPNLGSPIALSAWGLQLKVDNVDDPRVNQFIDLYREGKQAPESGASCSGGNGKPA